MTTSDLVDTIRRHWGKSGDRKSGRYVDQFFERTVSGPKISGKVIGNHSRAGYLTHPPVFTRLNEVDLIAIWRYASAS